MLAAGNSLVLKPSEKSPLTAIRVAQLAVESAKTGVKLSIGAAVGAPEAAVPLVKDLWHGLRGKK